MQSFKFSSKLSSAVTITLCLDHKTTPVSTDTYKNEILVLLWLILFQSILQSWCCSRQVILIQITLLQLHKEMRTSQTIADVSSICSLIFHERIRSAMWWNTRKNLMLPFIEQFLMQSQIGRSRVSSYPWSAIKVHWALISREIRVPKRSNIKRHVNNSFF